MACDTKLRQGQTLEQRKEEVRETVDKVARALAAGSVKPVVGAQGAIAFAGIAEADRAGVTDACIYRRLMVSGSATAKAAIARAEMVAGRPVARSVIGAGVHSHDGGKTWHNGH